MKTAKSLIPTERIQTLILMGRGQKVLLELEGRIASHDKQILLS